MSPSHSLHGLWLYGLMLGRETLFSACLPPPCCLNRVTVRKQQRTGLKSWPLCVWCGVGIFSLPCFPALDIFSPKVQVGDHLMQPYKHPLEWFSPSPVMKPSEQAVNHMSSCDMFKYLSYIKQFPEELLNKSSRCHKRHFVLYSLYEKSTALKLMADWVLHLTVCSICFQMTENYPGQQSCFTKAL